MASLPDETKQKMQTALEHLKLELKSLRTSRANPAMVDGVHVELYGSSMKIKELASITAPEPRMLLIAPFDPKNVGHISKAIEKANIGINPIIDGHVVRLKIPHMDENARKEMVKISHKKKEESKVTIRNIRRDMNEHARKMNKEGDLPEDQLKKVEKTIQELTDKFCKEADDLALAKEKEIMTI